MKLEKSYGWMLVAAVVMVAVTLRFSPQSLPLLLIVLVCPVAMFMMMWGMGYQAGDQSHGEAEPRVEHSGDRDAGSS